MFYSRYNTDRIANTENVLDPNNSAIKRLRCIFFIDFHCNLKFTLLISGGTAPGVVIKFHLTYT